MYYLKKQPGCKVGNVIFVAIFCLIAGVSAASAASPAIYFSDLIDGPKTGWNRSATKGAAVTIWGKNFGYTRGSSNYVTVGGRNLTADSDYAEWGATTNNARGMERITFWLKNNCATGAGVISVTVDGVTSNTVPFYVRTTGNIRFVDHTNGNDANDGQTDTTAWRALGKARQSIGGGDIVYIRAGTYTEADADGKLLLLTSAFSGSDNNYTAFVGYPAEVAILNAVTNTVGRAVGTNFTYNGSVHHIVTAKLRILPYQGAWGASQQPSGHFRVIALDMDGQNGTYPLESTRAGCIDFHDQSDGTVYGCRLYGWGRDKFDHFIYLGEDTSSNDLLNYDFGWNEIHDLGPDVSGIYIHPQDTDANNMYADNILIHDNLAYNLTHAGIILNSRYINVYIYNNISYHCGSSSLSRPCLYLNGTNTARNTSNVRVYNNIFHTSDASGLIGFIVEVNVSFLNNIFYSENNQPYYSDTSYTGTRTSDYNAWYGHGARPGWATGIQDLNNTDPLITSLATHDFYLQASSPAKDAGTLAVNTVVAKDYDGISRPQEAGFDIGAYEYAVDSTPPAAVTNLLASNPTATTVLLEWTAPGNDGNSGTAATYIIKYSTSAITTDAQFDAALDVAEGEPAPSAAGTNQSLTVSGLTAGTTYFFAMKTQDGVPNISALSNSASNIAPVLAAIGNKTVDENAGLTFTVSATGGAQPPPLSYSASGLPTGATLNSSTGAFSWTPTYSQTGSYIVTFSVVDTDGGTDSETITITVNNVNRVPNLAAIIPPNKMVNGNSNLSFTLNATDDDDDTLTYSATGLPSGATLNSSTGAFSWTPTNFQAGSYSVTFSVDDGNTGTASEAITITVTNVNIAPVITVPGNKRVNANSTLSFTLRVVNVDGDTLSYSATGLPSGATFNSSTGAFSWTPTDAQIGSYNITFNVDDGNSGTDSRSITITVRAGKIKYQAGWPKSTGGLVSSASLCDLDGDGDLEVVACYRTETKTYICAWHHDGTVVSGWSGKELAGVMNFAPGIADIDKDKLPEIIMGDENGRVWVWHGDGSLVAGFGGAFTSPYDDILTAPVIGDVDGDGDMEIIVGTGDNGGSGIAYLYVLDKSGIIEGKLLVTNKIRSTPAIGDIDGDDSQEIVVGCDDGKVYAWHAVSESAVSGFPVTAGNKVSSSPALGDIDNNGDIEIVVGSEDGGVYVWNHDGSLMSGWPKMTGIGSIITSSPALGDLDGDGDLEIAVGSENGYLYVWDYQGSQVFLGSADEAIKFSSPAIGDIDGDGDKEVMVGSDSDGVYAWHHNGVLVDGFALETSDDVQSSPTLADLDKDGDIELIAGSNDQRLHIWDLPGKFNSRNIDWGMFHMNPRYGGFYQKRTAKLTSVKITPVERRYLGIAGGTLFVEDATSNIFGLELTIPANAISVDTNIEIGEVENPPAFSGGITAVGTPVDFTSMNFSVPVMIKIPYTQAMLDAAGLTTADNLKIYTYNESTLTWSEPSGGSTVDTANRVVWIMVDHFSLFGLGSVAAAGAGGSSAGGGGCFIATAAYGTPLAKEVKYLSEFRDRYMLTNGLGTSMVRAYWKVGPKIARYIEKKEEARGVVRGILQPFVWIAKQCVERN